jgi:hypothetical protein
LPVDFGFDVVESDEGIELGQQFGQGLGFGFRL